MMEKIIKVLKVLSINDLSSIVKIDVNFLPLVDSEEKNDEEEVDVIKDSKLKLLIFISKRYYCFKYKFKEYLI